MSELVSPSSAGRGLCETIRCNCEISDARDHGIYSMCSTVLKLRNQYKWEHGIEPWREPEAAQLLDWIDAKERRWLSLGTEEFLTIPAAGKHVSPFEVDAVNRALDNTGLHYGAGYGRSMKAVFFLAEVRDRLVVEGCSVVIAATEHAREMAAPFAMSQNGRILIRLEPLRYFLWDHIQELRSSCKSSYLYTLKRYGLLTDGRLDQHKLRRRLEEIVNLELDLFIHHEIGELLETTLDSERVRAVISRFPGSVIEFVCRAVKDILADTHPHGALSHICRKRTSSSLGLYVSFLDGLRLELFPEMSEAWKQFYLHTDWPAVETARDRCRQRLAGIGAEICRISDDIDHLSDQQVIARFNERVLAALGLEMMPTGVGGRPRP